MVVYATSFLPKEIDNPYWKLLVTSLSKKGIFFIFNARLSIRWLWKNRKKVRIVHFHWPEQFYSANKFTSYLKNSLSFIFFLLFIKFLGYNLIWTVHNVLPHNTKYRKLSFINNFILANLADVLVIHGESIRPFIKKMYLRKRNIFIIPHGNYIKYYKNNTSKEIARKLLSLNTKEFVYLYFGLIREYKGVFDLVNSFKKLKTLKKFSDNEKLIIVGKPENKEIKENLIKETKDDEDIILNLSFISNDEVQVYFNAADVVVFPFKDITTSGSFFLALSFGKPVIALKKGIFIDYSNKKIGLFPEDESQFNDALVKIKKLDIRTLSHNAKEEAKKVSWSKIAEDYKRIYKN